MRLTAQHKTLMAVVWINATEGLVNSIFSPFLEGQGHSLSMIGFVVSVSGITSLLSRLPAGLLYRPWTTKYILRASLVSLGLSVFLFPMVSDVWLLSGLRAIQGLSFGVAATLNLALLMETTSPGRSRARIMAIFSALSAAGFSIGNFSSGLLVDNFGYQVAFGAVTFFAMLGALSAAGIPRDPASRQTDLTSSQRAQRQTTLRSKLAYARSPGIMIISLMAFSLYALYSAFGAFFPLYGLKVGLNMSSIGFLRGVNALCGTITRPISGEATRFAGHDLVSSVGLVASALLIAAVPSFDSIVALTLLLVVSGVARGMASVSNTVGLAEETGADAENRGIASGIFNTAKDLGNFAGPLLGGIVASYVGVETMLRVVPVALLAVYFVPVFVGRATGVLTPRSRTVRSTHPNLADEA